LRQSVAPPTTKKALDSYIKIPKNFLGFFWTQAL